MQDVLPCCCRTRKGYMYVCIETRERAHPYNSHILIRIKRLCESIEGLALVRVLLLFFGCEGRSSSIYYGASAAPPPPPSLVIIHFYTTCIAPTSYPRVFPFHSFPFYAAPGARLLSLLPVAAHLI